MTAVLDLQTTRTVSLTDVKGSMSKQDTAVESRASHGLYARSRVHASAPLLQLMLVDSSQSAHAADSVNTPDNMTIMNHT